MSLTDVATWAGTGLALFSVVITVAMATKANSAADRAEEMRDEIVSRKAQGELGKLNGMMAAARRAMDKYGPGAGEISRYGCSPDSDAATVRALTSEMQRLHRLLKESFDVDVSEAVQRVNELLSKFARAPNDTKRDNYGCRIYNEIVEFSGNIQSVLDGKTYK